MEELQLTQLALQQGYYFVKEIVTLMTIIKLY